MSYSFEDFYQEGESLARSMGHSIMTVDHLTAIALDVPSIVEFMEDILSLIHI